MAFTMISRFTLVPSVRRESIVIKIFDDKALVMFFKVRIGKGGGVVYRNRSCDI